MPRTREQGLSWDRIDRFRRSDFSHVLNQRYLQSWAADYLADLLTKPDDDFVDALREFLVGKTMLTEKTVAPILARNTVEEVREAFSTLLNDDSTVYDALDAVWQLDGAGPYFSTYMLALATAGNYILYEETLLQGMKEFAPTIAENLSPVKDLDTYFGFMSACRVVVEAYRFTSLAELHDFLWHGKDTGWSFE